MQNVIMARMDEIMVKQDSSPGRILKYPGRIVKCFCIVHVAAAYFIDSMVNNKL
jgi:hypothetical protein